MISQCLSFRVLLTLILFHLFLSAFLLYYFSSRVPAETSPKVNRHHHASSISVINIEIWSQVSHGFYLWEHILDQTVDFSKSHATALIDNFRFIFKSGKDAISQDVEYLILALNGRDDRKIQQCEKWLNFVSSLPKLKRLAVLLLGLEDCDNRWIHKYLKHQNGLIDCLFLIYDDPIVDDKTVFQWPLGVATYRGFQKFDLTRYQLSEAREYSCNFYGTVYKNSSRETLVNTFEKNMELKDICRLKLRYKWLSRESESSLAEYIHMLTNSDLTLNPSGMNNECYRIYEAASLGSIPIIEDRVDAASKCSSESLRILKSYENSPLIFIKDWDELPDILRNERILPQWKKVARRNHVVHWYRRFLYDMKLKFLRALNTTFLLTSS